VPRVAARNQHVIGWTLEQAAEWRRQNNLESPETLRARFKLVTPYDSNEKNAFQEGVANYYSGQGCGGGRDASLSIGVLTQRWRNTSDSGHPLLQSGRGDSSSLRNFRRLRYSRSG